MKIIVNGNETELKDSIAVTALLVEQNVKMPEMVSVELNGEFLRREVFESTMIKDGDKVEFLYFMGGGK